MDDLNNKIEIDDIEEVEGYGHCIGMRNRCSEDCTFGSCVFTPND